jgi:AbrB family looped-hinge helix DNA binding protein
MPMPDDPIVAVTRVSGKGLVLLPLEIREKLGLQSGTKLIIVAVEDAVVLQRVDALLARESPKGILKRIRTIFSKVPIRNIEE